MTPLQCSLGLGSIIDMLTLYHNDMSVCAAKVRTALAEKGLDWNGVHLDLRRGDAQKPEYVKLNPSAGFGTK
jgi:glutathione S-transferase